MRRESADPAVVSRLKELTDLSDADVNKVARAGRLVNLPANWSLIWEKTPADRAYFLLDGQVAIVRDGQEIAQLGAGDMIGEVAIVSHRLRTASVISRTPVQALTFTAEEAAELAAEVPRINEVIQQTTAQRLEADQA